MDTITPFTGTPEPDFEAETIWERISALDEMFPQAVKSSISGTLSGVTKSWSGLRKITWFFVSTAAILVLPLSVEMERQEYLEQAKRQEKEILFGS